MADAIAGKTRSFVLGNAAPVGGLRRDKLIEVAFYLFVIVSCSSLSISRLGDFYYFQMGVEPEPIFPLFVYAVIKYLPLIVIATHIKELYLTVPKMPFPWLVVAAAFLSAMFSEDASRTINMASAVLICLSLSILYVRYRGADAALLFIWRLGVVLLAISAVLALSGSDYALTHFMQPGWRGIVSDKNYFGVVSGLMLLLTLYLPAIVRKPIRLRAGVIALCGLCLACSNAKGALLATMAGIAFVFLHNRYLVNYSLWKKAVVLTVLASLIAYFGILYLPDLLVMLGRDPTLSNRTLIWAGVLPLTFTHPFGMGYGMSGGAAAYSAVSVTVNSLYAPIDNAYIVLALDLGWSFVAIYVVWLLSLVLKPRQEVGEPIVGSELLIAIAAFNLVLGFVLVVGGPYIGFPLLLLFIALAGIVQSKTASGTAGGSGGMSLQSTQRKREIVRER